MFGLDVFEELMNMKMLLVWYGIVANTQDHDVELVEVFGGLLLVKEERVKG